MLSFYILCLPTSLFPSGFTSEFLYVYTKPINGTAVKELRKNISMTLTQYDSFCTSMADVM